MRKYRILETDMLWTLILLGPSPLERRTLAFSPMPQTAKADMRPRCNLFWDAVNVKFTSFAWISSETEPSIGLLLDLAMTFAMTAHLITLLLCADCQCKL